MVRVLIKSLYCLSFPQSIRVSFWWNGLAACLAGVLGHPPFFGKRHSHPQLPFLSSWKRRCRGRARSNRDISWLIGVKGVAQRNIQTTGRDSSSV